MAATAPDAPLNRPLRRWLLLALAALALWSGLAAPWHGAAARAASAAARDPDHELVVLAYHEIAEPSRAVIPDYAVTPAAFQAQMATQVKTVLQVLRDQLVFQAPTAESATAA